MKKFALFLSIAGAIFIANVASAVTYPFTGPHAPHMKQVASRGVGSKVYLFCGTSAVSSRLSMDDAMTVYRANTPETLEVGKVNVLGPLGDYYVQGEVVGGAVQPGDLAKKDAVVCLITG